MDYLEIPQSFALMAALVVIPLGLSGCDPCLGQCGGSGDGAAASSDDGNPETGGLGWTSTSGATSVGSDGWGGATETWSGATEPSNGESDWGDGTTCGGDGGGGTSDGWGGATDTWTGDTASETEEETEGLNCGGMELPPDVVDMKMVRAGDLIPAPVGYSADTRFLVLKSQGSVCGPAPLAPPDCDDAQEFTLVVVIPPEFQAVGVHDFGDYESETGFLESELESWIHIGGSASCETGVIPNSAHLFIDTIEADGAITGRICNFYWMPDLGQGLSGHIDAASC